MTVSVGIVGATGYTGVELLRLLLKHPQVSIRLVTSRKEAGVALADVYPNLRGHTALRFTDADVAALAECDVVFFATPSAVAMHMAPALLQAGVRVIDLSADFRLRSAAEWERWYGLEHACPEQLPHAVYGLPELNREAIKQARLVANPGCYPTAILLGFLPLLKAQAVVPDLIADAKSGVSGAGRNATMNNLFPEVSDSFKAYSAAGHRHQPEILQSLNAVSAQDCSLVFVPHLTPAIRGIHATLYARLLDVEADLQQIFQCEYHEETFVDVLPPGAHPDTRSVRGGNSCRIAVHRQPGSDYVIVLSVIDNLVKGAAGQAIQNMNIMHGFDESAGLDSIALLP